MSVDSTAALLQRIPIFARLSDGQIAEIARIAEQGKIPVRRLHHRGRRLRRSRLPARLRGCGARGGAGAVAAARFADRRTGHADRSRLRGDHRRQRTRALPEDHTLGHARPDAGGPVLGRNTLAAHHGAAAQGRQRPDAHRPAVGQERFGPCRARGTLDTSAGSSGRKAQSLANGRRSGASNRSQRCQKKSAQPRGRSWAQEARHAHVPGGKPAPQATSSARRGALPMKSDAARYNLTNNTYRDHFNGQAGGYHEIVTDCFSFPQFLGLPRSRTGTASESGAASTQY